MMSGVVPTLDEGVAIAVSIAICMTKVWALGPGFRPTKSFLEADTNDGVR